jgi:hypothetical protein
MPFMTGARQRSPFDHFRVDFKTAETGAVDDAQ